MYTFLLKTQIWPLRLLSLKKSNTVFLFKPGVKPSQSKCADSLTASSPIRGGQQVSWMLHFIFSNFWAIIHLQVSFEDQPVGFHLCCCGYMFTVFYYFLNVWFQGLDANHDGTELNRWLSWQKCHSSKLEVERDFHLVQSNL